MTIEIKSVDYHDSTQSQQLIQLLDTYARDPMGGGEPLPAFSKENLAVELSKIPGAFSLVAYIDDKPVGFSNCFEAFSTFACKTLINIHDIAVLSQFRGRGIAMQLLQRIDQIAQERGCGKVTLEVLEGNAPAKTAYLKHGFSPYEMDPEFGVAQFWHKQL